MVGAVAISPVDLRTGNVFAMCIEPSRKLGEFRHEMFHSRQWQIGRTRSGRYNGAQVTLNPGGFSAKCENQHETAAKVDSNFVDPDSYGMLEMIAMMPGAANTVWLNALVALNIVASTCW